MGPRVRKRSRRRIWLGLLLVLVAWASVRLTSLLLSAAQPVDAVLVLGGSIQREVYAARLAREAPQIPILISQGSEPPCIWEIFERDAAPISRVWLELCADSTFGNFYYSVPILERWGKRHVRLVSTRNHFPRAGWLGRILLGAKGIWLDEDRMGERGVPANTESPLKTAVDVTRALGWAVVSQVYTPQCGTVQRLDQIDLAAWKTRGYRCERIVPQ